MEMVATALPRGIGRFIVFSVLIGDQPLAQQVFQSRGVSLKVTARVTLYLTLLLRLSSTLRRK